MDSLQKISDGSLDDVEFPYDLRGIKQEPEDDFKVEVEETNYDGDFPTFDENPAYQDQAKVQIQEKLLPKTENEIVVDSSEIVIDSNAGVPVKTKKIKKKKVIKDGPKKKMGRPKKDVIVQKHLKKNLAMCKLCGIEVHGLITHHRCSRIGCKISESCLL